MVTWSADQDGGRLLRRLLLQSKFREREAKAGWWPRAESVVLKYGCYLNVEPMGLLTDCRWAHREALSHLPGLQLQMSQSLSPRSCNGSYSCSPGYPMTES